MKKLSKFASPKLSVPRATKPLGGPEDTVPLYKTFESRVAEITAPYGNNNAEVNQPCSSYMRLKSKLSHSIGHIL